ncbi:hypothetical protein HID58_007963 [Brassica napus]|uniref:Mitochondrial carrier protein n=1 Tax=Brassica napus TaxID=3708 RepID=A0ABQ7XHP9_BRANA|nr:hypothetical protein HID58_007963 [Brassica napus]
MGLLIVGVVGLGKHKWALKLHKSETGTQGSANRVQVDGMVAPSWQWENATAGAVAGFATVAAMHPLDVVRTRFQRVPDVQEHSSRSLHHWPSRGSERPLCSFFPAVIGSTLSWSLYFFLCELSPLSSLLQSPPQALSLSETNTISLVMEERKRYARGRDDEKLTPPLHLASAAESGALVCLCTNPIWLVRQVTASDTSSSNPTLLRPIRTIMKEEGPRALYKGFDPDLVSSSSGFLMVLFSSTAYEELRKVIVDMKEKRRTSESTPDNLLVQTSSSSSYTVIILAITRRINAALGGSSKVAAVLLTYPFQVIRARLQQRPSTNGIPRYRQLTCHQRNREVREEHISILGLDCTEDNIYYYLSFLPSRCRFEGLRGFYRGLTANLLKNVPASSSTFIVYENVLKLLKQPPPTR